MHARPPGQGKEIRTGLGPEAAAGETANLLDAEW